MRNKARRMTKREADADRAAAVGAADRAQGLSRTQRLLAFMGADDSEDFKQRIKTGLMEVPLIYVCMVRGSLGMWHSPRAALQPLPCSLPRPLAASEAPAWVVPPPFLSRRQPLKPP